ncbi:MAG: hypothetical protein Sapg2KO_17330 [Saprospiraceae bacterium]
MKIKAKRLLGLLILTLSLSFTSVNTVDAQCPMCRMSAESNLKNGGEEGKGLNNGILYLLATPYLMIGGIAYFWYRNRRKEEEDEFVTSE